MITVFERIPDIFVEMYDAQFGLWAREYRKRGRFAAIVFNRPPGIEGVFDEMGQLVWWGAWFEAVLETSLLVGGGRRMVIKPRTEHDVEMVERHCREMLPHWLH